MYSKENQDRDWEYALNLIIAVTNYRKEHILNGIASIRKLWEQKAWVFPFVDEDGRRELPIDSTEEPLTQRDISTIFNKLYDTARRLVNDNPKIYGETIGSYSNDVVEYLVQLIRTGLYQHELMNNKLAEPRVIGKKKLTAETKVSKWIKVTMEYDTLSWDAGGKLQYLDRQYLTVVSDFSVILYSQFLSSVKERQTDKIVVSVNPLDILTASMHTAGSTAWTSCHNLGNGGWRTGPVSYLTDPRTLIAFAYENKADYKAPFVVIPNHPIKKWRQMVYVDEVNYGAFMSREYPERKPSYSKYARKITALILSELGSLPYHWKFKIVDGESRSTCRDEELENNELSSRDNLPSGMEYIAVWNYHDYVTTRIRLTDKKVNVKIGTPKIPCLACGEPRDRNSSNDTTGNLMCRNCPPMETCSCCGKSIKIGREFLQYDLYGDAHCESCWNSKYEQCYECGEWLLKGKGETVDDHSFCSLCMTKVFKICSICGERVYREDVLELHDGSVVCPKCEERIDYCMDCDQYFRKDEVTELEGEMVCNSCRNFRELPPEEQNSDEGELESDIFEETDTVEV